MSILRVENIKKRYGNTNVLKGISFSIEKGEILSILGASGGGKTTLLRCINFLERADAGKIYVEDKLAYDYEVDNPNDIVKIRECQKNFGFVFQQFNLFPQYTVKENLMLAPKLLLKEKKLSTEEYNNQIEIYNKWADDWLNKIDMQNKSNNYPCELSGGQQQRASIARCLMLCPKIVFFDEPTSALDPQLTNEVLKVIKSIATKNVTMIVVTHEINFAKNISDKIIFMANGNIVEEGKPSEVIDNPKSDIAKNFFLTFSENNI